MITLEWDNQFNLGDILTVLGLLLTAGLLFFTGQQVRAASQQLKIAGTELSDATRSQRAQFLMNATTRYFNDENVRKLFYDINYNKVKIRVEGEEIFIIRGKEEEKSLICSEEERLLDSLLYTLDTIGRVVDLKNLDERDAMLFAFQAYRVLRPDSAARTYLKWLKDQRNKYGGGEIPPFQAAERLAGLAQKYNNSR